MTELAAPWSDPATTALLVIDIQNDYIHPEGALARIGHDTSRAMAMIPRLERLIAAARSLDIPRYFLRNAHGPETDSAAWTRRRTRTRGTAASAGTRGAWGADWYAIRPQDDEVVVDKYRYDGFLGTPLEVMLRARGRGTVVCCGTQTNVCVESTARSAHMRDFDLVVVEDCCAATDASLHDAALENIRRHFGLVVTADELETAWRDADGR